MDAKHQKRGFAFAYKIKHLLCMILASHPWLAMDALTFSEHP